VNNDTGNDTLARPELPEDVEPGKVHVRHVRDDASLRYFVYVPKKRNGYTSQFVSVHGVSRNAREHADRFAPLAEEYGVVLVAPLFSRRHFGDYQRLGRAGSGRRADQAIQLITREIESLTGADSSKISLFGFSGGGQFAHRYAMAHPGRVRQLVIGAAGWYTYPDESCPYPYGTASTPGLKGISFNVRRFLQVPACVLVGQWDIKQDPGLNQSRRIQRQQGTTRLERGRRWIDAMNQAAIAHGMVTSYEFSILPGVDHDFSLAMKNGRLGQRVFRYLFGVAPSITGQGESPAASLPVDVCQTEPDLPVIDKAM